MFLTNILLKKVKSKHILVQMESVVSGHTFNQVRERLAEKVEALRFDPFNRQSIVQLAHLNIGQGPNCADIYKFLNLKEDREVIKIELPKIRINPDAVSVQGEEESEEPQVLAV